VAQFALPAFTSTARTAPCDFCKCARATFTGAACTRFCVNTAATEAGPIGNDQREIVAPILANARIRGGIAVTSRQIQAFTPRTSLSPMMHAVHKGLSTHTLPAFLLHLD
jgi:putative methionine-R-sulfoxide reductase with GAF domain